MDKSKIVSCKKLIAGKEISLETGKVARQATASVIASSGDTGRLGKIISFFKFFTNSEFLNVCALLELDEELNPWRYKIFK